MKRYTVHFSGFFGYDAEVEAENSEDAIAMATDIFANADSGSFDIFLNTTEVVDEEEIMEE